jgi:hypothetical protein
MDEFSNIWIEQCDAARGIRDDWGTRKRMNDAPLSRRHWNDERRWDELSEREQRSSTYREANPGPFLASVTFLVD